MLAAVGQVTYLLVEAGHADSASSTARLNPPYSASASSAVTTKLAPYSRAASRLPISPLATASTVPSASASSRSTASPGPRRPGRPLGAAQRKAARLRTPVPRGYRRRTRCGDEVRSGCRQRPPRRRGVSTRVPAASTPSASASPVSTSIRASPVVLASAPTRTSLVSLSVAGKPFRVFGPHQQGLPERDVSR